MNLLLVKIAFNSCDNTGIMALTKVIEKNKSITDLNLCIKIELHNENSGNRIRRRDRNSIWKGLVVKLYFAITK